MTPSGTYNHNLHHAMPSVLEALNIALKLAQDVGTDRDISVVKCAVKSVNNCEIMYSDAAYESLTKFNEECRQYWAD